MDMEKIEVRQLTDNFFTAIGKEWMLVTAGNKEHFNTMTASWGCIGWLWNKPVAVAFIRPERFTHTFVEQEGMLTLSFLGNDKEVRHIYNICGSKSGRDCDKVAETGLRPVETEMGNITFQQARLVLECRKLYKNHMSPTSFIDPEMEKWYKEGHGDYHDIYILEIVNVYKA